MRKNKNQKLGKKNMGFSLVEVLVTMLIIAVISIPIIRTFTSSARVNYNARKLQHATDTAQNVSELFTAYDIDTLVSDYGFKEDGSDVYVKDVKGDEDEDFKVKLTLNELESYDIPELKNFFGQGAAVCFKEITRYDTAAREYIVGQGFSDTAIYKKTVFNIEAYADGTYNYKVKVIYSSPGAVSYEQEMTIDYSVEEGKSIPTLYILYTNYGSLNADDVEINYTTDDVMADNGKLCDIYFIKQDTKTPTALNISPVITYNGSDYNVMDADMKNMEFHDYSDDKSGLTMGNRQVNLYGVIIEVYYDGEVITKITDVKQITQKKES